MIGSSDLANRSFRMTREDGSLISASVFLLPDGRVFGTRHPNESFWAIAGDAVEFLDPQRMAVTRFTRIERGEAGWRLEGPYLPGGPHARHILEESAGPIDMRDFDLSPIGTSVVVMVRAHFIDDRVLELMYHLDHGRRNYDLYLTIDETNGRPETDLQNVIWHSVGRCTDIGLSQARDRLLWWCGDFPFYFALSQMPQYQYYAMIEYDVHLTQCDASLLNELVAALTSAETSRIDAVGTRLRREDPRDDMLHAPAFRVFETTYSYFFPLIALSRPAVSYLYAQRQLEAAHGTPADAVIHAESFVPSHLIRAGFTCVDLNALVPGSYRNDLMILSGRQHGLPRSLAEGFAGFVRMIHPVYSDSAFLRRLLSECQNEEQKQALSRRLDGNEFELISPELRARFQKLLAGAR